jgi:hypothetical protein
MTTVGKIEQLANGTIQDAQTVPVSVLAERDALRAEVGRLRNCVTNLRELLLHMPPPASIRDSSHPRHGDYYDEDYAYWYYGERLDALDEVNV